MANRLINEQSPYLLQHAHNPVDWYPWGDEAFNKAEEENKPVLVSIGYAACHWCHVMERESFENEAVAGYMNEHFVCIKVDREEYPGVDHMYMDAVQAITGSGGWPLNAFVTPGRVPFFGGTYFPPRPAYNRPSWMQQLEHIVQIWQERQSDVIAQSEQMVQYLKQVSQVGKAGAQELTMESCKKMAEALLKQADTVYGGFGGAPKFPGTMAISFLLEHYHFTGDDAAKKQALLSLDAMINGGIYDQLGGGFARYATDNKWLVPHFEKMLYDNALLVMALCDAYSVTKDEKYRQVITETIAFVQRELMHENGGYYSALDADSEGVEGKFYTWKWEEWDETSGTEYAAVADYFGVSEEGNWEGTNILHTPESVEAVAVRNGLTVAALEEMIAAAKRKLFDTRKARIRPLTDDKCLLSWNALMNVALTKAGVALSEEKYVQDALKHMQWMLAAYVQKDGLKHNWKNGVAKIAANLDDYAFLIQAMLQLASVSGELKYILQAAKLVEICMADFKEEKGNMFYFTSARNEDIPVRKIDVHDGAIPSANAVMAQNLLLAGLCMERTEWQEQAVDMLQQTSGSAMRYAYSFGYWAVMMQRYAAGIKTAVCTGEKCEELGKGLQKNFIPQCYIVTSQKEISEIPLLNMKYLDNRSVIFVCTLQACLAPITSVEKALTLIRD